MWHNQTLLFSFTIQRLLRFGIFFSLTLQLQCGCGNGNANANDICMLLIYLDWNWAHQHDGTKATETYKLWTWQQMCSTKLRRWTVEWFFGIDNRQRKFASFDVFVFEYESIVTAFALLIHCKHGLCFSPFLFRHCAFGQLSYWQCHLDAITWCHSEYHQLLKCRDKSVAVDRFFLMCKINGIPIFISIFFNWLYRNELQTPD